MKLEPHRRNFIFIDCVKYLFLDYYDIKIETFFYFITWIVFFLFLDKSVMI